MQCNFLTLFQAPMALILTSVKWWENYVDTDRGFLKLFELKKAIQLVRIRVSVLSSMWNIIVTFLFVYLLELVEGRRLGTGIFITPVDPAMTANMTNQTTEANTISATVLSVLPSIVQVWHHLLLGIGNGKFWHFVTCSCWYINFGRAFLYSSRLMFFIQTLIYWCPYSVKNHLFIQNHSWTWKLSVTTQFPSGADPGGGPRGPWPPPLPTKNCSPK